MMKDLLSAACAHLGRFLRANRGNVAMMFGIALVPMTIAAGVGLDYARAAQVKSQISDALDAASLAIGATTPSLAADQVATVAQKYFAANYKGSGTVPTLDAPVYDKNGTVTLSVTNFTMDTAVLKAVGISTMKVSASSTVVWGQSKLWVSLVLDNSGSMSQSNKMTSLKSAAKQLLTTLQGAATTDGDVEVAIVPFTNDVNAGTGISNSYIDWSNFGAQLDADVPDQSYGPGDDCPYSYGCRTPADSTKISSIPDSGTYKGYICPWVTSSSGNYNGTNSHWYMGCFKSTSTGNTTSVGNSCSGYSTSSPKNCTCTGSGWSQTCKTKTWTHAWVTESSATNTKLWKGCFTDRTMTGNVDTLNTQPSGSSGFAADNSDLCPAAPIMTLSYNWTGMSSEIDAMQPAGSTNQAIGLAHGWQMLTPGAPYATPTVPSGTSRFIILLSDGLNTQDRWYGNGMNEGNSYDDSIDARMATTCTNAKKDGIIIYTLFLNTNSTDDSDPLKNCATDTSKYFKVTASADLAAAFATIGQQITSVRVSK